jgi:hypothetical protein
MTTTTQPSNLQGMIVALVMMRVWLAFPITLGADVWANNGATFNSPIKTALSGMLLWISLFMLFGAGIQFLTICGVVTPGCGCYIVWMIISPASDSSAAPNWIYAPPFSLVTFAGAAISMLVPFFTNKWHVACWTGNFNHVSHHITKTSKWVIFFGQRPPVNSLSGTKFNESEVGLWLRLQIFSQLHCSWKKSVRLFLQPRLVGHRIVRCGSKFSLIDLEGEIPDKAEAMVPVDGMPLHRERLSERTSLWDGAIVCSASNMKMQNPTEMIGSLLSYCSVTS